MENNGAGAAQSPGARNADVQRPDGTPVRVLVVDDEPSLAELLASVLRYEGWNVVTAGGRGGGAAPARVPPRRGGARHHASRLQRPRGDAPPARRAPAGVRAVPDRAG